MAEAAAQDLAGRRVQPPPPKRRADALGEAAGRAVAAAASSLRDRLGLQRRRVDAVGVQTFVDRASLLKEALHGLVRDDDMRRRDRLLLVQAPDVQLVHRLNTGDLWDGREAQRGPGRLANRD